MDAGLNDTRMKMLGEFAEMALVLGRDLQQAALAAETYEEKVRLADAFHRAGRGMRQSLALHAKFERDGDSTETQTPFQSASDQRMRREARSATLRRDVERLIWTERERLEEDPDVLGVRLMGLLARESRTEDFLSADPGAQIARLCEMLGVPAPAHSPPSPLAEEGVARSPADEAPKRLGAGPP
jgi:hypothetical protein